MMAVDFRCERCGRMLKVEAEPGERVRCPHCRRRLGVPAALASLPRPHLPPNAGPEPQTDGQYGQFSVAPPFMVTLAGIMPWVLSAFLHFGLFLVMVFILMVSAEPQRKAAGPVRVFIPPPTMGTLGGFDNPRNKLGSDGRDARRSVIHPQRDRDTTIDRGETDTRVVLLDPGAEGRKSSARAEIGLDNRGIRGGPEFIGTLVGPGVHNIVYVVDRSGSMAGSFDGVRLEMQRSISRLTPQHSFHVILFSDDEVIEGPRAWLVPADEANRERAGHFLQKQQAVGRTTALVALRRAFAVLRNADKNRPGKLIYLLSDGDFAGMTGGSRYRRADGRILNGNEAVLQWLRDNNRSGEVLINTFLLDSTDRAAIDVLRTIAREHGGQFKYVSPDEHP